MPETNRRVSPRVVYSSLGILQLRQGHWVDKTPYICDIKDLSAEGVCFETEQALGVDSCFSLTITRQQSSSYLTLFGDVVWVVELPAGKKRCGAKLYTTDFKVSEDLRENVAIIQQHSHEYQSYKRRSSNE